MSVILIVLTFLVLIGADYVFRRRQAEQRVRALDMAESLPSPVHPGRAPRGVFFHPGHTWVFLEESGAAKLGIDEFAQSVVGDVDAIVTPKVGENVPEGGVLLKLRHGKRTAEFRAPIGGVVREINDHPPDFRGESRSKPFTDDWLCKLDPTDVSQVSKNLVLGEAAGQWLRREVDRLKVFVATLASNNSALGQTMQDGGLPCRGLIDELSEAEWRKLRERFFDKEPSRVVSDGFIDPPR